MKTKSDEKKSLVSVLKNVCSNELKRQIEIYELISDLNSPSLGISDKVVENKTGDFIVIVDGEVWIQSTEEDKRNKYHQASYNSEFVRANSNIFKKS